VGVNTLDWLKARLRLNNGPLVGVILSEITLRLTARSSFTFNKRLEQRNDRVFKRAVL